MVFKTIVKELVGEYNIAKVREGMRLRKEPLLANTLKENKRFKNKHIGERCFILGNGPSLKNIDFSLLSNEITFTVNQLARNPKYPVLKNNYHMWSDYRFFDLHPDRGEDMELLDSMKAVNTKFSKPTVFYRYAAKEMVDQFGLEKELDIHYFEQGWHEMFPKKYVDFTRLTPAFSTVVHYAVCLAVYMGFDEIYLLGCDCSSIITIANTFLNKAENSLYGYNITENEKKRMERVQSKSSFRDELVSTLRLFSDYERILQYCNNNKVKLFNATENSLLDSVPKVRLDEVLCIKSSGVMSRQNE